MIKIITNTDMIDEVMRIYEDSFPVSERQSNIIIINRINSGEEKLIGYFNSQNKLLGIALLWDLGVQNCILLDYFAISSEARGNNFGTQFIESIVKDFINEDQILVLEVENPYDMSPNSLEYRRLMFYKKFDCIEYPDYNYFIPAFDRSGYIDFKILTINRKHLKVNNISEIAYAIYTQIYSLLPEEANDLINKQL